MIPPMLFQFSCTYQCLLNKQDHTDVVGASLVAQLVKNVPAMQETPTGYSGWEDPVEKG